MTIIISQASKWTHLSVHRFKNVLNNLCPWIKEFLRHRKALSLFQLFLYTDDQTVDPQLCTEGDVARVPECGLTSIYYQAAVKVT